LSGKTTIASLSAIVTTSTEKVSNVYKYVIIVLFILLICAILWAVIERQLRKRKVIEMSERIVKLEKFIDKNRSSSYLNKNCSTRREEKHDV
jgi:flagellar biosynthesis/type III secretory pathway M-ring protein FliF/YscJ